jgi:hypothetical protein
MNTMTDKEIMERLNKGVFEFEARTVFTQFRQAVFSSTTIEDSYLLVVNKRGEGMQSFLPAIILQMPFSDILSKDLEFYTKEYKIVLMVKKPKPTYLDKVEENYLRNIIAPLARSGCSNFKVKKYSCNDYYENRKYCIRIFMENHNYSRVFSETIQLPKFDVSQNMYRGLENGKIYSLDYLVE